MAGMARERFVTFSLTSHRNAATTTIRGTDTSWTRCCSPAMFSMAELAATSQNCFTGQNTLLLPQSYLIGSKQGTVGGPLSL